MKLKKQIRKRAYKGQGLVEFALVMPIFFLLVGGIIDLGWMIYNYSQLYNGLREALRYGSVSGYSAIPQYQQCDGIKKKLMTMAIHSGIRADQITIVYDDGRPVDENIAHTVAFCATNATNITFYNGYIPLGALAVQPRTEIYTGDRIAISATANVRFLTPVLGSLFRSGIPIQVDASRTIYPGGLGL
jgi:hypothetical protein